MIKILSIVGARPQFVKAAMVSRCLQTLNNVTEILMHTGQHYDDSMSKIFFDELQIPKPKYDLGVGSGTHGKQTGEMLTAIEAVLLKEKPQIVLVYGDTNSTLAGTLAAVKLHIPVAHVEAGLRSFNRKMPEEINRIVADQLSELLFVPNEQGMVNLSKEGVCSEKMFLVGDVMYDAALFYSEKALTISKILEKLALQAGNYILATVHRAENTDDKSRLKVIIQALNQLAKQTPVILPLHPRTHKMLEKYGLLTEISSDLKMIQPVGFLDMVMLEKYAKLIITDSGGVQKEAFFYQVPCVTLRDETEWVELIDLGWNFLASPTKGADFICTTVKIAIDAYGKTGFYPYGRGNASVDIVSKLQERFF